MSVEYFRQNITAHDNMIDHGRLVFILELSEVKIEFVGIRVYNIDSFRYIRPIQQ